MNGYPTSPARPMPTDNSYKAMYEAGRKAGRLEGQAACAEIARDFSNLDDETANAIARAIEEKGSHDG